MNRLPPLAKCFMGALLLWAGAWCQSDIIISKGAGTLVSGQGMLWMFDKSQSSQNINYSRLDLFNAPPEIYTTRRDEGTPFNSLTEVGSALLGHTIIDSKSDGEISTYTAALIQLQASGEKQLFDFTYMQETGLSLGIGLTDVTVTDSLYLLSYGNAGFAVYERSSVGDVIKYGTQIDFFTFTSSDSLYTSFSCPVNDTCDLTALSDIESEDPIRFIDEMELNVRGDTHWLYLLAGSYTPSESENPVSLYRGMLGESQLKPLEVPGLEGVNIGEVSLKINPYNDDIWIFTQNSFLISRDHGESFTTPSGIPEDILNRLQNPSVAFLGDTAVVNFNFSGNPGLATFVRDSLVIDESQEPETYAAFYDGSLSPLLAKASSLGDVVFLQKGGESVLVAGHSSQGLFYRNLQTDTAWNNITLQTSVAKGLREVITFPTVYDGSVDVGLGYQLTRKSEVSIYVYNYAMEMVRTIVEGAPRLGGGSRSEDPLVDVWDARDNQGNRVAAGMYYVLIRAASGERGWGKIMVTTGKWQ